MNASPLSSLEPLFREALRKRPYRDAREDLVSLVRACYVTNKLAVEDGGIRDRLLYLVEILSTALRVLNPNSSNSNLNVSPFMQPALLGVIEGQRPASSEQEAALLLASGLEDAYDEHAGAASYMHLCVGLMNLEMLARRMADGLSKRAKRPSGHVGLEGSVGLGRRLGSRGLTGANKPHLLFAARGLLVLRERQGERSTATPTGDTVAEFLSIVQSSEVESQGADLDGGKLSKWVAAALKDPKPSEFEDAELALFVTRLFQSCCQGKQGIAS